VEDVADLGYSDWIKCLVDRSFLEQAFNKRWVCLIVIEDIRNRVILKKHTSQPEQLREKDFELEQREMP
jgi:hypothetical protein